MNSVALCNSYGSLLRILFLKNESIKSDGYKLLFESFKDELKKTMVKIVFLK